MISDQETKSIAFYPREYDRSPELKPRNSSLIHFAKYNDNINAGATAPANSLLKGGSHEYF